jgi:hypothetical protein
MLQNPTRARTPLRTAVGRLLERRRPPAVGGVVRSVVVDAINGVTRPRLFAHVGEECLERSSPALAHDDAAPTPVSVAGMGRAMTPRAHRNPRLVLRRMPSPVRLVGRGALLQRTAATPRVSALHKVNPTGEEGAATAREFVIPVSADLSCESNDAAAVDYFSIPIFGLRSSSHSVKYTPRTTSTRGEFTQWQ